MTTRTAESTIHIPGMAEGFLEPRAGGSEGRLRYLTGGQGAPLVLLHTVRTQAEHFQHLIPLVADRYTVFALDLPGMGYSDIVPGASYDEPAMRHAVTRLLGDLALSEDYLDEMLRVGRRPGYPTVARAVYGNLPSLVAARTRYPAVTAPVHVVYGRSDWSRASDREANRRHLPQAQFLEVADAGHFLALEQPQALSSLL